MKKILSVLLFFLPSVLFAGSAGPETLFGKANKLYKSGNYTESVKLFEDIIRSGYPTAEVYYNLGNSYYKSGDLPRAIINYERAKRLSPLDEDIQYNLRMAYSNTIDKIDPIPLLFYERWWQGFIQSLSPGTWGITAIIILWIALLAGILYLTASTVTRKRNYFILSGSLLICAIGFLFVAYSSNQMISGGKAAILVSSSAYIKSSPDAKSTNLFMLHEGTRIDVLDELPGWKQIRIANGNVGWVDETALEII